MIRLFARRLFHSTVAAGADEVFFGMTLPSDSVIHDIAIEGSYFQTGALAPGLVTMYSIEGWILPLADADAQVNYNTHFDRLVPKDTDTEAIDLDSVAADATPFFEPGEPDFTGLFDIGYQPERIYKKERMLTIANGGSILVSRDPESPFTLEWYPGESFKIRIRKRFRVSQPSILVFAVANPALDDTTTTTWGALTEAQLPQLKYLGHVLERALLHLMGLTETGAETPWEDATALLKAHLEPDVYEASAGQFQSAINVITARGIVDHSVVGRLQNITVSTS